MQDLPDYSGLTSQQLRRIIRNNPNDLSKAHYLHILNEIELRDAQLRASGALPASKSQREVLTRGQKIVQAVAIFEYGAFFVVGVVWPIGYQLIMNPGDDMPVHMVLLLLAMLLFVMAKVGLSLMYAALRTMRSQALVHQWSQVAACVAPFSCAAYSALFELLRKYGFRNEILSLSGSILGFYMPFILITVWLKYKYRTDEF